MIEYHEYTDAEICVKIPAPLRQERAMRYFRGNLVRGHSETMMTIAIDIDFDFDDGRVEAIKSLFLNTNISDRPPGNEVLRLGPCPFGEDGLELLTSFLELTSGRTLYRWDMLFRLRDSYVMFSIMGALPHAEFESIATDIVSSFRFRSQSDQE